MGKGQEDMCSSWCRDSEEDAAGEIDAWAPVRRRSVSKRSTSKSRDSPASSKRRRSLRWRGGAMMAGFHCSEQVNFDSLSEDFVDCIHGKYESASNSEALKEQWVDKHRPCSIAELAVHKKKVDEVRVWLEERINASKERIHNYTLLITGQAGVGKSAVIQAIASHLEAELCEWKTPTPTLWKEHLHNSNSGVRYMSKLDEFETFVDTLRRYPVLPSNGLKRPVIVLIDDLPVTNGKAAHRRLCECLHALTSSAKVPTVILVTEYSKDDSNDVRGCHLEELLSTLERAGAHKVCFNPLTVNSIRKTLSFICQKEEHDVAEEVLNQIARLSQGDIRHAITSLQYFCLMPEQSKGSSLHPEEHPELAGLSSMMIGADDDPTGRANIPFGRDETLSLFHALGKFLHNKRVDGVQKGATLQERLMRLPLKMDTPEDILRHAHAQARPVVDFLHENVLDFLSDESADDAWTIASYLSDADCLLSSRELLAQFAAASVSVRGVLFGNAHPSSPGWRSIRRPQLWEAERAASRNKAIMGRGLRSLVSITELAAEVKPAMRWLGIVDVQQAAQYEDEDDDDEDDEDDIEEWRRSARIPLSLSLSLCLVPMAKPAVDAGYLKEIEKARRELRALISRERCAPIMLRLAWHDAGTYDARTGTGGPNGSIRNASELRHAANAGLKPAVDLCEKVKAKCPRITHADLFQLAGVVAVEITGGPTIDFVPGRPDSWSSSEEGRLPVASEGAGHLRQVFGRMGLSDKDIVALSGGHTLVLMRRFI